MWIPPSTITNVEGFFNEPDSNSEPLADDSSMVISESTTDSSNKPVGTVNTNQPKSKSIANTQQRTRRGLKTRKYVVTNKTYNLNKVNNKNAKSTFTLVGQNAAGVSAKLESLYSVINKVHPSAILIQESKVNKVGKIKLKGYQVFEKIRDNNNQGGGLLTAVVEDIKPVLIDVEDSVDIIVVEVVLPVGRT